MQSRCHSYYSASIREESNYPQLVGRHRVDIAIIGGGFTGVATAVELAERGYKVAIIEANKIGWGASGRNGGQITGSLSGDVNMTKQLRKLIGNHAEDHVWKLRWRGHQIIENRVKKYNIACDLKYGHLQAAYKKSHLPALQAMYNEANARGMGQYMSLLSAHEVPDYLETPLYHGALLNQRNMHVHSLDLCIGEAKVAHGLGTIIFENSEVTSIEHGDLPTVKSKHGSISANAVLLAGNAYHKLEQRKLRGTLFPASLGCIATKPLGEELAQRINSRDLAVYDSRIVLDYHRLTADRRLLFGGGTNYSGRDSISVQRELRPMMEETYPSLKGIEIEYEWTCTAGIVLNRIPLIGNLSNNVFYCQGYSGHGIATSHVMGNMMGKAISLSLDPSNTTNTENNDFRDFKLFAKMSHLRFPLPEWLSGNAMALGMAYYKLLERFK